jgi:hypothetical protein
VQRDGRAFGDEAREEDARLLKVRERGGGVCGAEDNFGKAWRGNRELRSAGSIENDSRGIEPVTQKVKGEKGLAVVVPVREAGGGQLAGGGDYRGVQGNAFLPGAPSKARRQIHTSLGRWTDGP